VSRPLNLASDAGSADPSVPRGGRVPLPRPRPDGRVRAQAPGFTARSLADFVASSRATAGPGEPRPACAGMDPESFFFDERTSAGAGLASELRALCAACPRQPGCLEEAVDLGDWEGFRGGKTGRERRALDTASTRRYRSVARRAP
jgi:hypothetical protein